MHEEILYLLNRIVALSSVVVVELYIDDEKELIRDKLRICVCG
jgi:hypothetical protein